MNSGMQGLYPCIFVFAEVDYVIPPGIVPTHFVAHVPTHFVPHVPTHFIAHNTIQLVASDYRKALWDRHVIRGFIGSEVVYCHIGCLLGRISALVVATVAYYNSCKLHAIS